MLLEDPQMCFFSCEDFLWCVSQKANETLQKTTPLRLRHSDRILSLARNAPLQHVSLILIPFKEPYLQKIMNNIAYSINYK